jgi:hypothetical protein
MPKQNIGPRLEPGTKNFYEALFRTVNAGAEYVLEMFPRFYGRTLGSLCDIFSADELAWMIRASETLHLNPLLAGQNLIGEISYQVVAHLFSGQLPDMSLEEKLSELETWQLIALEIWCRAFWDGKTEDKLEDYVKILAKD